MSGIEERILRQVSGAKILLASAAVAAAGVLPLLLYIQFGPRDGNPIGLGLLAVVSLPVACVGAAVGAIKLIVERFARRRG